MRGVHLEKEEEDMGTNYVLAMVVGFLGLVAGFIISRMAKEELKGGARYFALFKRLLIFLMFGITAYYLRENIFLMVVLLLWLVLSELLVKWDFLVYGSMALLVILATTSEQAFLLSTCLVFLYGLPTAAIVIGKVPKQRKQGWFSMLGSVLRPGLGYLLVVLAYQASALL